MIRDALSDPETEYVLLTRNRRKTAASSVNKIAIRHAVRAGVAVRNGNGCRDAGRSGQISRVSHHAYRARLGDNRSQREGDGDRRCVGGTAPSGLQPPDATTRRRSPTAPAPHLSNIRIV
jgi:hypothetical protein